MPTMEDIKNYYDFSKLDYQLYNGQFNNISMHYGLWDENIHSHKEALLNENRVLSQIANITKWDYVVDFGCGYGSSAVWLAKHIGCRVVGITLSEKQVESAKKLAKGNKVEHLTKFLIMDFHQTSFENESFDVVLSIESISHSETKLVVLKEAYRILKKGGKLVVADGFFAKDPKNLFEQWILQAGFKDVRFFDKTKEILPIAKKVNKLGRFIYPFSKILNKLGVRALQPSHMEAFINQYYAFRDGLGVYGIFYARK